MEPFKNLGQKTLTYHNIRHIHESKGNSYECQICRETFLKIFDYKEHLKSAHEGKEFRCEICDVTFTGSKSKQNHVAVVHEGKKPFKCKVCGMKFKYHKNMRTHNALIHDKSKLLICDTCSKKFTLKSKLVKHIEKCILKPKKQKETFECDNCDENFESKMKLKAHFIRGCVSVPNKRKKPSSLKKEIKMEAIPTLEQFENDMKKEGIVPKNSDTKNKPQLSKNNGIKEEKNQPKNERGYLKLDMKPTREGKTKREIDYLNFLEFKAKQKKFESHQK